MFGKTAGPIVYYTVDGRRSLPVLMHEAGHAYHVHMLRDLSVIAETWRCEAFAYYSVLRTYEACLRDGVMWEGFAQYIDAHTALCPKAMGLARIMLGVPEWRAVRLCLAGQ